jgi:hypothetical protein
MLYVAENQHRWKLSLATETCRLLDEFSEVLAWAWGIDTRDQKSYPHNASLAFHTIKNEIANSERPQKQPIPTKRRGILIRQPSARVFSELVDETAIKRVYEDQNADLYKSALLQAARGDAKVFRKILRAVDSAYVIGQRGAEAARPPRIHFLHRSLLELAELCRLDGLTDEGMVEFLEDLCPCGQPHQSDAIRKFRKRWSGIQRNKRPKNF